MKKAETSMIAPALAWALVMILLITGCSTLSGKGKEASGEKPMAATSPAAPAVKEMTPVYYDFGDVMVPRDLSVEKKESFVMNSGGMTSGVLVLKGSADANSLVTFFENKMPVDGWRQMGDFRSARSIMLFEKKTRWCVISIADGQFSTKVEIWVAPTLGESPTDSAR